MQYQIKGLAQVSGIFAGYGVNKNKGIHPRKSKVFCFAVRKFVGQEGDEIVGEVWDPKNRCLQEADALDAEEGFGPFLGYFEMNEEGHRQFLEACDKESERILKEEEYEDEGGGDGYEWVEGDGDDEDDEDDEGDEGDAEDEDEYEWVEDDEDDEGDEDDEDDEDDEGDEGDEEDEVEE